MSDTIRFDYSTKNMHGDVLVRNAPSGLVVGNLGSLGDWRYFTANHGRSFTKEELRALADKLEELSR